MKEAIARFFRLYSQVIAIVIIVLCVLGILVLQTIAINRANELTQQIAKAADERSRQIDEVNKNIDCVVKFFAQDDRTNKSIAEISDCRIKVDRAEPGKTTSQSQRQQSATRPIQPEVVNEAKPVPVTNTPPQTEQEQPSPQQESDFGPVLQPVVNLLDGVIEGIGL